MCVCVHVINLSECERACMVIYQVVIADSGAPRVVVALSEGSVDGLCACECGWVSDCAE